VAKARRPPKRGKFSKSGHTESIRGTGPQPKIKRKDASEWDIKLPGSAISLEKENRSRRPEAGAGDEKKRNKLGLKQRSTWQKRKRGGEENFQLKETWSRPPGL